MTHYATKNPGVTSGIRTPGAWLSIGAQIGRLVNEWSARSDLAVVLNSTTSGGHPALYDPRQSEIEISTHQAFGVTVKPEQIGALETRKQQLQWATAVGAIFHEASHARFSRFSLEAAQAALEPIEFNALVLLEEGRIEAHGLIAYPTHKVFLQSVAMDIVVKDMDLAAQNLSDIEGAAQLAALVLARVDAGVLDAADVEPVSNSIVSILGADTVAKLRSVWLRAQAYDNHFDAIGMYPLAKEWVEILREAAQEAGEQLSDEKTESGEGEGEGEGSGMSGVLKELMGAVKESADNTSITAGDAVSDMERSEDWKESVSVAADKSKTKIRNSKIANDTFYRHSKEDGTPDTTGTHSELLERRAAKPDERVAAVRLSQLLDKARYRERDVTVTNSVLPPGRLRTGAAVQAAALKERDVRTPVETWKSKARKHTDDPTLTIGVMVDISGSMSTAMEPMATTAWVLSEAGKRVQARSAMVYYGQDVFPVLKPGQSLDEVKVFSARDMTEKFDKAFSALDGSLNLLYGTGARLLVVVSDGNYVPTELQKANQAVLQCERNGVAVLWLDTETGYPTYLNSIMSGAKSSQVVSIKGKTATEVATLVGQAAVRSLESIGKRNAG